MTRRPDSPAQFVEQIAVLLEADGLPRVAGRLFGLLLVSPDARSLDELADQLGVSKPSVSVNARLLEEKGVVERVGRQGDRRDYYRIADDILQRTLEQRINRWRRFHETFTAACETCAHGNGVVRGRLTTLARAYEHMLDATERALSDLRARASRRAAASPSSPRSR